MTKSYWQSELDKIKIGTTDGSAASICIRSHNWDMPGEDTATKWLRLTPQQFEQVKGFLLSIEEGLI